MDKTEFIWMDGKLVDWKDAKIHVLSHTLHYGGGVFEGIRCYETEKGTAIFRLKEHIKRLFYSAKAFEMQIPYTEEEICKAVLDTVKANKLKSGYIRPIIFFGYGKMGLNPEGSELNVSISCWPWAKYLSDSPIKVKISNIIKTHPKSTISGAKISGNYANSILASLDIHKQGYDEALLLDYKGNIAEGPGENLFIVKDKTLITPRLGNVLPGITRDSIIAIAKDLKIKVKEKTLKPKEIYGADESFFTGTAAEITAIGSIDDKIIGSGDIGEITKKLKNLFYEIVQGKNEKYSSWLEFVN